MDGACDTHGGKINTYGIFAKNNPNELEDLDTDGRGIGRLDGRGMWNAWMEDKYVRDFCKKPRELEDLTTDGRGIGRLDGRGMWHAWMEDKYIWDFCKKP